MIINNKVIGGIAVCILILLWYTKKLSDDCTRYKAIIDKRLYEPMTKNKSKMKRVRFDIPDIPTN